MVLAIIISKPSSDTYPLVAESKHDQGLMETLGEQTLFFIKERLPIGSYLGLVPQASEMMCCHPRNSRAKYWSTFEEAGRRFACFFDVTNWVVGRRSTYPALHTRCNAALIETCSVL